MSKGATEKGLESRAKDFRNLGNAMLVLALACAALSLAFGGTFTRLMLSSAAATFALLGLVLRIYGVRLGDRAQERRNAILQFAENDAVPCFMTNDLAEVMWSNRAGNSRFGRVEPGESGIAAVLSPAALEVGSVCLRLLSRAEDGQEAIRFEVLERSRHQITKLRLRELTRPPQ